MKPALLVIDIQNVWLDGDEDLKKSVNKRIDAVNEAIGWFRRSKHPIVVIYHEDKEMGAVSGTEPFEFPESVGIEENDVRVTKHYPNAFRKTELEACLRKEGCDTVAIVGLSASGCALATYFGAMDYDLKPYLVRDAVASHSEEHVRFAEDVCDTLSVCDFDKTLR